MAANNAPSILPRKFLEIIEGWPSHHTMRPRPNRIVINFDWPTFVNTLRELHMACSQERMAQELGVCAKTISNWERAVVQPQWRHKSRLLRLAVHFKYTRKQWPAMSWVAKWSDDLPPRYRRRRRR